MGGYHPTGASQGLAQSLVAPQTFVKLSPLDHAVRALAKAVKEGDSAGTDENATITLTRSHAFLILRAMKQRHIKKRVRRERIATEARVLAGTLVMAAQKAAASSNETAVVLPPTVTETP